ncbi:c-type cytochrome biogenesis protein CcmI [Bradyrhizobium sp. U87765 SZCCT0131]|uniref:c-type cytochrome biogenesis protein CcmI n=1 Tax=unclassified Bradyrhizobium TaxID=2631580 RepID=UPI001BAA6474|nr:MULTISPECIES: c-type cytochrome biogenesis protein CcmI [unclassified Bradyrhizobium]MBR1222612.1 c-type cytochrome biogenesis protein CcmI [Bradyrhizobium sp. U87765 SZCCT0131]MBR1265307.1 c-type cytochrome biogenesis protein CcmI [Bradyrhizobium sp. U87765 SZCCT0134]MBR1302914.1 c-type cytochrome biogenesis protein CcmI [Bradyrhizobium sp. U87765 SZCCT0110]MBR1323612.1 c-type cytochrome biogenesis protein CcmI [Bradyrhizobium sp. U87765 SZCCT0109]MBR1346843.1 c-type cytochrome biogenesis 
MSLWFVLALMTATAVLAVLWPLARRGDTATGGRESIVYKDQIAEIARDRAAGLIGVIEAEAARVEIGRRLLAASDADAEAAIVPRPALRRATAILALIGLPLLAVVVYLRLGSPMLPDFPLAERARQPVATASLDNLVSQVEAHLEKNPTDGRGWEVLAPVLMKLGRFDDAVQAFRKSLATNGESAGRHADLGEALAAAANGVVTAEAKAEFERAVALHTDEVKARYFLGLAAEQDGRTAEAATIWRAMLANAPAEAPWRPLVQAALVRVGGGVTAPVLSNDEMAAAKDMTEADRTTMIRGMVDRLATRLKQNGNDVDGWLRLLRAYKVLGDGDKVRATLAEARAALGEDAERLRQFNDGLKGLGLDG